MITRCDNMEFDIATLICIILSVLVGAIIFKFFKEVDQNAVDKVFDKMKVYMESYGPALEKDKPELYAKVQNALSALEKAYTDGTVSALEALEIATAFYPVFKELSDYVKSKT